MIYLQTFIGIIFFFIILFFIVTYFVINVNDKLLILKRYELLFNHEYAAPFVAINKNETPDSFYDMIDYPVIFKPDFCSDWGACVEKIENSEQARNYVANKRNRDNYIIVQDYINGPYESTVHYFRNPLTGKETIEIASRNTLHDGVNFIWGYKNKKAMKKKYGTGYYYYLKDTELYTPDFINQIKKMIYRIGGINICRFDIRYSNKEQVKKGYGFQIMEMNDQSANRNFMYVGINSYPNLVKKIYLFIAIFANFFMVGGYGFLNLLAGNATSPRDFLRALIARLHKFFFCNQMYTLKFI